MKRYVMLFVIGLLATTSIAWAGEVATAKAGKFTVELSSQPNPPTVGENLLIVTVKDGEKPVNGAGVDVHIDMTSMPMPADAKATPGGAEGQYGATLNFSMAGTWKVDVAVEQMAGMKMDGDGTAHFIIETGKSITGKSSGGGLPWQGILLGITVVGGLVAITLFRRRLSQQHRGIVVGILTLVAVFIGTTAVVRKYRDPKQATVVASALMDMSAQAAPGTVAVSTEEVHAGAFQATARYTGTVVPDSEEDIYPGDTVAAGQVVAQLDTTELAAKEAQAAYGSLGAAQAGSAAGAEVSAARAAHTRSLTSVDMARAQLTQAQSAARGADGAVKATQSDLAGSRQRLLEADSAVSAAQAGVDQANEGVLAAQAEVDSAQADVNYWATELAREKKLYAQGAIAKEELDRETAQAETAKAKLNQAKAAVRTAQAGVTRAKQELAQAQARSAAARAAIDTAQARLEQAQADRDSAAGRVTEAQAAVQTAQADSQAAEASVSAASARASAAQAEVRRAQAALTEASTVRGYTAIRASNRGVVTARNIAPGTLVQPGMSILKVAKIDYVRLQANVSEADMAAIRLGQMITAHTVDDPGRTFSGRITSLFPAKDTTARTTIVEARIPNPGEQLLPGQYITIDLQLGGDLQQAISVPNNAVITRDGQTSVFVAASDGFSTTAKRVAVQVGLTNNDRTAILSGLHEGDQVIVAGQENLKDGDKVTAVKRAVQQPAPPAAMPAMPATEQGKAAAPQAAQPEPAAMAMPMPKPQKTPPPAATQQPASKPAAEKPAKQTYYCPMDVDMVSDKPGKCPKCGMDYIVKK